MKRLLTISLLIACGLFIRNALGQTEATQARPPKNPLLPRAPEFSSWTIVESLGKQKTPPESTASGGAAGKDIRCTITKTGTTYREIFTEAGLGEVTKWVVDALQIKQVVDDGRLIRIPRSRYSPDFSDYLRSDFENFEWITRETYKGVRNYEDKPCYVFEVEASKRRLTPRERSEKIRRTQEDDENPETTPVTSEPSHTLTAYLDVATQLPVALREGERLTTYTFNPPPTAPLSPPADVLENFAKWRETIQSRNRPPPRP